MKRTSGARPAPAVPVIDESGGVELLEDRTRRIEATSQGRRLGVSVPAAVAGSFLVVALAFGAVGAPVDFDGSSTGGQRTGTSQDDGSADTGAKDDAEDPDGPATGGEDPQDGDEPKPDGADPKDDGADPKDGNAPDEPGDEAPATPRAIDIGVALNDGKVVVEWGACETDGFYAWKVVRSRDATITWPKGGDDTTVGAFEDPSKQRMVDSGAPAGWKLAYRVFGIALLDGDKLVACASEVASVTTPEPRPEPKPDPKPEPRPDPRPEVGSLGLKVVIDDGHPWVDWSACEADGFEGYKVVRSKDDYVKFPAGDNDSVVAFVGADGKTAFFDKEAPAGRKLWYRVFCVDKVEGAWVVRAASAARSVVTPEAEPLPDPVSLGFELDLAGEGVVLHWEACTSEQFAFYKVVRSPKPNPSYLPGTDGSQVIAVVENASATEWLDEADSGTWYYRVQAIGYHHGTKFLLGQTPVLSVTVE